MLSEKVSEILPRTEHVSVFPTSYLPNYFDEPRFIVDDLNFLILCKMLWIVVCGRNKTLDLLSKNLTFFLKCFLEDIKTALKSLMNEQKQQRRYNQR